MPSVTPRTILVVDDDSDTALTFASVLEGLGHTARFTTDPRSVLGIVTRLKPDAVFLDVGMPHLDGFQLARLIKQASRQICVVAISGHDSEEYRKRGREAGFDAYVTKPVDAALLESILKTLFGQRSVR